MFIIHQPALTNAQQEEMRDIMRSATINAPAAFNVTSYKITPNQLEEIEAHLSRAAWILNSEELPEWEDLQTTCREIADAMQDIKTIREKVQ